ncbi:MAG: alkaline phosphatase [Desulfitobacteriaceae bacterium]
MPKVKKSVYVPILLLVLVTLVLTGCSNAQPTQSQTANANGYNGKPAKYVFLFIGDGMGTPQINSAEVFLGSTGNQTNPNLIKLNFSQFASQGMTTTYAADSFIPDSASAGTAIASGQKTSDGVINMDPGKKTKFKSIAELAKEKGMKVGVVSSVSLDHATPACFYAHQASRNNYYDIDMELAKSSFDYFGGGGLKQPKGKDGQQPDALETAKSNGFKIITTAEEIEKLDANSGKVIAVNPVLDEEKALPFAVNGKNGLTLAEFTKKGIDVLDNPKGFFMMVEGGKIDWAGHANDAASAIKDTLALNDAVAEAIIFYNKHPEETAILVTADHETGGMTIGFAGTKYGTFFNKIANQKISYDEFDKKVAEYRKQHTADNAKLEDLLPLIKEQFGLSMLDAKDKEELEKKAKAGDKEAAVNLGLVFTNNEVSDLRQAQSLSMKDKKERPQDDQTYLLYGGYEPLTVTLTHILNHKAGIGWTTYSHTGIPIPVFAKGAGEALFNGYYDDTDLFKKMTQIMGSQTQAN